VKLWHHHHICIDFSSSRPTFFSVCLLLYWSQVVSCLGLATQIWYVHLFVILQLMLKEEPQINWLKKKKKDKNTSSKFVFFCSFRKFGSSLMGRVIKERLSPNTSGINSQYSLGDILKMDILGNDLSITAHTLLLQTSPVLPGTFTDFRS